LFLNRWGHKITERTIVSTKVNTKASTAPLLNLLKAPAFAVGAIALFLTACTANIERATPSNDPTQRGATNNESDAGNLFGEDGLSLFNSEKSDDVGKGSGIGVNSFLWRATLDTLSFMPLASADPFGGVVLTEWYATPQAPDERFKMSVFILDRRLRADGIRVSVFKEVKDANGGWASAAVNPATAPQLENSILSRARQLRIDSAPAL
jgi:hypothetical protein